MNGRPASIEPDWQPLAREASELVQRARHEVLARIGDDAAHPWWPMALELGELAGRLAEVGGNGGEPWATDPRCATERGEAIWRRCRELRTAWVDELEHWPLWLALGSAAKRSFSVHLVAKEAAW